MMDHAPISDVKIPLKAVYVDVKDPIEVNLCGRKGNVDVGLRARMMKVDVGNWPNCEVVFTVELITMFCLCDGRDIGETADEVSSERRSRDPVKQNVVFESTLAQKLPQAHLRHMRGGCYHLAKLPWLPLIIRENSLEHLRKQTR